ncbi:30S ribosomal protein S10 [Candidatus Dojkabacteria bacterium]|nr:30S ribosomal protein S10 [Candidatus Dojkabacteria bacterium]
MAVKIKKLRVKIKGYDAKVVESSSKMVLEAAYSTGSKVLGPVLLPRRRRIYCVTRSPHIEKRSMEHFEKNSHVRLIDILEPTVQTVDSLQHLELPAGVDVEVKSLLE